jgi:hypothetical protein
VKCETLSVECIFNCALVFSKKSPLGVRVVTSLCCLGACSVISIYVFRSDSGVGAWP